jgi:hypothetical protein
LPSDFSCLESPEEVFLIVSRSSGENSVNQPFCKRSRVEDFREIMAKKV